MSGVDWTRVRHFVPAEFPNDPEKVLPELVMLLDQVREDCGQSIIVHVAWDSGGHVPDSTHYEDPACAVDFHIVGMSLLDQWLFVERYPFRGIGLYPYWNTPGLHADLRILGREHPNLGHRWWRDRDGIYKALDRNALNAVMTAGV